jgi:hypothetical protein
MRDGQHGAIGKLLQTHQQSAIHSTNKNRKVTHVADRFLDQLVRFEIASRRGLVEHKNFRLAQRGAGKTDQLALAGTEVAATLRHMAVEPVFQCLNLRFEMRRLKGCPQPRIVVAAKTRYFRTVALLLACFLKIKIKIKNLLKGSMFLRTVPENKTAS